MNSRAILLIAGFLALTSVGLATPANCTNAKMNVYDASGYSCIMGEMLFSNFSYSWVAGPDANYPGGFVGTSGSVPDTSVDVAVNASQMSISFGGNWQVTRYLQADLTIQYTAEICQLATCGFSSPDVVSQFRNQFSGGVSGLHDSSNPGSANTAIYTPNNKLTYPVSQTSFSTNTIFNFPGGTPGPITILNTAHLDANNVPIGATTSPLGNQTSHLSFIADSFSPAQSPGVPEPMSFVLLGGGLLTLAGYKKFRNDSK
jgi:hypothetical protein